MGEALQRVGDEVQVRAPTEERNAASHDLDRGSALEILTMLNQADAEVAPAVAATLPELALLVDATVERIRRGGSVHYVGAGTSGRLAVLDAAELRPTFNLSAGVVCAHHAGGREALVDAVEGVEDDADAGRVAVAEVTAKDVVVGLTASGRTPYVRGALELARERGALTALVTANPQAELAPLVEHLIAPDTGAEVVTGSTRLKAGTAQKLVLNGFSTAVMVRLGHTFGNLMVDVVATNAKLRGRVVRILCEAAGVDEPTARTALRAADDELKPALLCLLADIPVPEARSELAQHGGVLAAALSALRGTAAEGGTAPAFVV
ncbi:MAG: N-acetylmuramic acid 6-phosphate etherase [Actinomycetota bacterium]|nr:N-acetylmuramic acid 6-phosphate etherase [Actinomycetota bacterium]